MSMSKDLLEGSAQTVKCYNCGKLWDVHNGNLPKGTVILMVGCWIPDPGYLCPNCQGKH